MNKCKIMYHKSQDSVTSGVLEEALLREGERVGFPEVGNILFFDLGGGYTDVSFIILLNCPNMFYTVFCI